MFMRNMVLKTKLNPEAVYPSKTTQSIPTEQKNGKNIRNGYSLYCVRPQKEVCG